ncbi:pyridoxamine 5'-phosphate oxidase family protein [Solicola gregarius]|uniref:Pyridoxamine 5'-phosphate oxidase family protein n=1 Tax=Solicola gregarius TaxID=2908642 RepID=A0AA46TI64_9ACTN|nr:pyridoxamine 5'-phosphate oxidase family protein [Solicola gregarius]UYM05282.1 pyridoxamine 5'-phosphate oxidase family protein [Solicola gregarius]
MTATLSPTARTRVIRSHERAESERSALYDVLDSGMVAHLGVVIDAAPRVLPTVFAYDPDGPDLDGTLYFHGSVASRSLVDAPDQTVCLTITLVDGLVLARSGFHHSVNYRSAVVLGNPRPVDEPAERDRALDLIIDHLVPGRAETLRPPTRKDLAATTVLAVSLHEASVKARAGGANDEAFDVEAGDTWAGIVPLTVVPGAPITNPDCPPELEVPQHVRALVRKRD